MGRYDLVAPLPAGQDTTFLARRRGAGAFERYVVVRILDLAGDEGAMVRLQADEALWPLGRVHHHHFANLLDVDEHSDTLLVVTEYVHGRTARDVLDSGAQLPYDFGLTVVAHAASALHYLHTRLGPNGKPLQLVHGEISPALLHVSYEGAVKLGLGMRLGRKRGSPLPHVDYLSPEHVLGKPLDPRSDVFALGSVLYELTCGRPAFRDTSEMMTMTRIKSGAYLPPSQVIAGYPPELEAIVVRALQVVPEQRYDSAAALRRAIEALGHHYELVLGDAAIVEVMAQLFPDPREPWAAPEPARDVAPAYDFDQPSVRPHKAMRSATELVEELASVLDVTAAPRAPSVPANEFDDAQPTALAPPPAALAAAPASPPPAPPPAPPPDEPQTAEERVRSIQRLFTESAFDARATPLTPIEAIDTPPRTPTNRGVGLDPAITDGVEVLPASVAAEPTPPPPPATPRSSNTRRIAVIAAILVVLGGAAVATYVLVLARPDAAATPDAVVAVPPPDAAQVASADAAVGPAIEADAAVTDAPPTRDAAIADARPARDAAITDARTDAATRDAIDPATPTVRLQLTSIPTGATVVLDGKRLGKTPFDDTVPLTGKAPHAVKLRMTGYNTIKIELTGELEHEVTREVTLTKAKPKPEEPPADTPPNPSGGLELPD